MKSFETHKKITLDASHGPTRKFYEKQKRDQYNNVLNNFKMASVDYIEMGTDLSISDTLSGYFRYREKRKK